MVEAAEFPYSDRSVADLLPGRHCHTIFFLLGDILYQAKEDAGH